MAEAAYSTKSCVVNLTYAPRDDLADKMLTPRHFQLFMKLLRRAGHKVRYLVAGEYGDEKGRAHFHAILFFTHIQPLVYKDKTGKIIQRGMCPRYIDDYPEGFSQDDAPFCEEIPQERMVHIREWSHGHITVDWNVDERSVRYVCKYLTSDDKNNAWFSLSKKPALGAAFFAEKARKARELGVLPSSFEYIPPGGNPDKKYLMTGATRRDYMNAITKDNKYRSRMNEWVLKAFDKYRLDDFRKYIDDYQLACPLGALYRMIQTIANRGISLEKMLDKIRMEDAMSEYVHREFYLPYVAKMNGFDNVEELEGATEWLKTQGLGLDRNPLKDEPEPGAVYPEGFESLRRSGIGAGFYNLSSEEHDVFQDGNWKSGLEASREIRAAQAAGKQQPLDP